MSIKTRLESAEELVEQRQAAKNAAPHEEFKGWIVLHWTDAERAAFHRMVIHEPLPADMRKRVLAKVRVSEAQAAEIVARIPAPTDADRKLVTAAWARLPADLTARLKA